MILPGFRNRPSSAVLILVAATGFLIGAAGASRAAGQAPSRASNPKTTASEPRPGQADAAATGSGQVSWFAGGEELYVPPYYDSFKGLDLSSLTPPQRERFIHWVNTEFCTCAQTGCQRDTIANCYTNDPVCPRAPGRIRDILAKVKEGVPASPGAPTVPPPPGK